MYLWGLWDYISCESFYLLGTNTLIRHVLILSSFITIYLALTNINTKNNSILDLINVFLRQPYLVVIMFIVAILLSFNIRMPVLYLFIDIGVPYYSALILAYFICIPFFVYLIHIFRQIYFIGYIDIHCIDFSLKCVKDKIHLNSIVMGLLFMSGCFLFKFVISMTYLVLMPKLEVLKPKLEVFDCKLLVDYIFKLPLLNRYRHYALGYYNKHSYVVFSDKQIISLNKDLYLKSLRYKFFNLAIDYSHIKNTNANIFSRLPAYDKMSVTSHHHNDYVGILNLKSIIWGLYFRDGLDWYNKMSITYKISYDYTLMQHIDILNLKPIKWDFYFRDGIPIHGRMPINSLELEEYNKLNSDYTIMQYMDILNFKLTKLGLYSSRVGISINGRMPSNSLEYNKLNCAYTIMQYIDILNFKLRKSGLYYFRDGIPINGRIPSNILESEEYAKAYSIVLGLLPTYDNGDHTKIFNLHFDGEVLQVYDGYYKLGWIKFLIFINNYKIVNTDYLTNKAEIVDFVAKYGNPNSTGLLIPFYDINLRALEAYNSWHKLQLYDHINKHILLMRAYMWYNNNSLGPYYKQAFDFWQKRNVWCFVTHRVKHMVADVTPYSSHTIYIPDMTNNNVLYKELCVDILDNQLQILKLNMLLDKGNNINYLITESDLISTLGPLTYDFDMEYKGVDIALKNASNQVLLKYSTNQIVYEYNSLRKNPHLRDIAPDLVWNKKYRPAVGLGLVQKYAYPECHPNNP